MTSALPPGQQDAGAATTASTPATSPVGIPRIGLTPVLPKRPAPSTASTHRSSTLLVDAAPHRLRRNEDLLDIALIIVGAASMLILAAYAHETTTGVTLDVRNALAVLLRQILIFPLQTVEGLATFAVPVAVILSNLLRRSWRTTGESLLGGLGAGGSALLPLRALRARERAEPASSRRLVTLRSDSRVVAPVRRDRRVVRVRHRVTPSTSPASSP